MVAKHLKNHVSGWVIAALAIAFLVVTAILIRIDASAATINAVLAWTALSVVIAVFGLTAVAQYDAWKEEREAREHADAELAKAADIQGISRISISPTNPYADQTRPGSWFRCECDCSTRKPYVPILSRLERRAYQIAHRLIRDSASYGYAAFREYATPGRRRTAQIDAIARILMEEMERDECL